MIITDASVVRNLTNDEEIGLDTDVLIELEQYSANYFLVK
jgi:hypothetical protein